MASFISSKIRSLSGADSSSSPSPTTPTDRHFRPFSMASSVTVVPPSPIPPTHQQTSTLATLQYQEGLIADFWSGSAARAPSPPRTSSSSHTSSTGSAGGRKTKWGNAIQMRESERSARTQVLPEPKTRTRLFFLIGFLCPLLWLVGALIFFYPTPQPEMASLPVHSTEERERRLAVYRTAEAKWAKRCLWAWVCVMGIVPIIAVTAVLANKHGS